MSTKVLPVTLKRSPWGSVQYQYNYAPGVDLVGTASHGGFKLDSKMNAHIPEIFRRPQGWYEEDCESGIVMYFLADVVPDFLKDKDKAKRTVIVWFWQEWERFTGKEIQPGESAVKDDEMFRIANVNRFVVQSAMDIGNGIVGVLAYRQSDKTRAWFKVPAAEYVNPGRFVIDESRHERSETKLF